MRLRALAEKTRQVAALISLRPDRDALLRRAAEFEHAAERLEQGPTEAFTREARRALPR